MRSCCAAAARRGANGNIGFETRHLASEFRVDWMTAKGCHRMSMALPPQTAIAAFQSSRQSGPMTAMGRLLPVVNSSMPVNTERNPGQG